MEKLTDEVRSKLALRTANILSLCAEETDCHRILSQTYCELMPDKTPDQGEWMADRILNAVQEYLQCCEEALHCPSRWIYKRLQSLPKEEQAGKAHMVTCWLSSLAVLLPGHGCMLTGIQGQASNIESSCRKGEQFISGSAILHSALTQISACAKVDREYYEELTCRTDSAMRKAVVAMVIYTAAMNNELSGVPYLLHPEQVVLWVCMEDDLRGIGSQLSNGYLTEHQSIKLARAVAEVPLGALTAGQLIPTAFSVPEHPLAGDWIADVWNLVHNTIDMVTCLISNMLLKTDTDLSHVEAACCVHRFARAEIPESTGPSEQFASEPVSQSLVEPIQKELKI